MILKGEKRDISKMWMDGHKLDDGLRSLPRTEKQWVPFKTYLTETNKSKVTRSE